MDPQAPVPQQPNPMPDGSASDPFTPPSAPTEEGVPLVIPADTPVQPVANPMVQPNLTPLSTPDPASVGPASVSNPAPQVFGPATPVDTQNIQPGLMPQSFSQTSTPKRGGKLKFVLIVLLGIVLLGGGSAAAYFGMVVPNKPENILKAAFKNTANQKNVTAKATAEGKADSIAYKSTITTKANRDKKSIGLEASVTVSGFTFTGEARYVDKTAYVKVGDLSNITDIISAAAGLSASEANQQYATMINDISKKVANQWYEVDSTLLKEANADCVLESDFSINDADYKLLADEYAKNPFVTIDSSAGDTVDGKSATKFQLTLDEKKASAFGPTIEKTSLFKKLTECDKSASSSTSNSSLDKDVSSTIKDATGDGKTSFTLWVDKKTKTISRVAAETTPAQAKESGVSTKLDATFDYSPVTIEKPSNSKPITSLISEVMNLYQDQPVLGAKIERLIP